MNDEFLWTEIYRPKKIKDTVLPETLKSVFQNFVDTNKVPNTGAASIVNTWYDQPPSSALAANQWLFQLDGTKTAAGVYSWDSTPYLSSFKVGALTAISANIGTFVTETSGVGQTVISGDQILIKSYTVNSQTGQGQYVNRVIIGNLSGT